MITFDSSLLLGYYQAKTAGQAANAAASAGSSSSSAPSSSGGKTVPSSPWTTMASEPSDLVKAALNGRKFVDEGAAVAAAPTITGDYKKLFAAYQALNTLSAIANRSSEKGVTDSEIKRLQAAFSKGLNEVNSYVQNLSTDGMRLTTGAVMTSDKSSVGVPKNNYGYVTNTLYSGQSDDEVPAFKGAVSFTMSVKEFGVSTDVVMDLSEMGDAADDVQRRDLLQRQAGRRRVRHPVRRRAHGRPGADHHGQRPDRQAARHRRRLRPAHPRRLDRGPDLLGSGRQAGGLHHHRRLAIPIRTRSPRPTTR